MFYLIMPSEQSFNVVTISGVHVRNRKLRHAETPNVITQAGTGKGGTQSPTQRPAPAVYVSCLQPPPGFAPLQAPLPPLNPKALVGGVTAQGAPSVARDSGCSRSSRLGGR